MTDDARLIAALRRCERCAGSGWIVKSITWRLGHCPHCRLARMAADRIEARNRQLASLDGELKAATACEIAERVRERCAKECDVEAKDRGDRGYDDCAAAIRALTVEELLK